MSVTQPHQLTTNVKLLQKVVLHWEDKILFLQRSEDSVSRPLCWDLPGGNSEWPQGYTEPISDLHQLDAAREVHEETGLIVEPSEFSRENLSYFETFFDPTKQVFTVLLGWNIHLKNLPEDIRISEEHKEFRWLRPDQARELDFGGSKGVFLSKIVHNSR